MRGVGAEAALDGADGVVEELGESNGAREVIAGEVGVDVVHGEGGGFFIGKVRAELPPGDLDGVAPPPHLPGVEVRNLPAGGVAEGDALRGAGDGLVEVVRECEQQHL